MGCAEFECGTHEVSYTLTLHFSGSFLALFLQDSAKALLYTIIPIVFYVHCMCQYIGLLELEPWLLPAGPEQLLSDLSFSARVSVPLCRGRKKPPLNCWKNVGWLVAW